MRSSSRSATSRRGGALRARRRARACHRAAALLSWRWLPASPSRGSCAEPRPPERLRRGDGRGCAAASCPGSRLGSGQVGQRVRGHGGQALAPGGLSQGEPVEAAAHRVEVSADVSKVPERPQGGDNNQATNRCGSDGDRPAHRRPSEGQVRRRGLRSATAPSSAPPAVTRYRPDGPPVFGREPSLVPGSRSMFPPSTSLPGWVPGQALAAGDAPQLLGSLGCWAIAAGLITPAAVTHARVIATRRRRIGDPAMPKVFAAVLQSPAALPWPGSGNTAAVTRPTTLVLT